MGKFISIIKQNSKKVLVIVLLIIIIFFVLIPIFTYRIMQWEATQVPKKVQEYLGSVELSKNGGFQTAISAEEMWDKLIEEGYDVNQYLKGPEDLEKLMNAELVTQMPDLRSNTDELIDWDKIFKGEWLDSAKWLGDEKDYVLHMKKKMEYYDSKTDYGCIIDADLCRLCIFQKVSGKWKLIAAWNTIQGVTGAGNFSSGDYAQDWPGPRSRTFKGVGEVIAKVDVGNGDYWTCYIDGGKAHTPGSDDCQRFNLSYYGDPDDIPAQDRHMSHGCTNLTAEKLKWVYDNIPMESRIVIFDQFNPLPSPTGGWEARANTNGEYLSEDFLDEETEALSEEEKRKISPVTEGSLSLYHLARNTLKGIIRFKRYDKDGNSKYITYAPQDKFERWIEEYQDSGDETTRDLIMSHFTLRKKTKTSGTTTGGQLEASENDVIVPNISEKLVNSAKTTGATAPGHCLEWVDNVWDNAGITVDRLHCACCAKDANCVSTDRTKIPIGASVYSTGSGSGGDHLYGHIGVYIGNGMVMDSVEGTVRTISLDDWAPSNDTNEHNAWLGWGWEDGDKTRGTTADTSVSKANSSSSTNSKSNTTKNTTTTTTAVSAGNSIEDVISAAESQIGQPYNYEGSFADVDGWDNGAAGFNCSGLVWWAFEQAGFEDVPHSQCAIGASAPNRGMIDRVYENCGGNLITDTSQLQRGDILFYDGSSEGRESSHVAIYLGDGKRIHSNYDGVGEDDNAFNGSFIGGGPLFTNVSRAASSSTSNQTSNAPGYQAVIATYTEINKYVSAGGPDYKGAAESFGVSLDTTPEYIVKTTTVDYETLVEPYTMQFAFIWALLVTGQSRNFALDLAKLVYKSDITIGIYDNSTITTDIDRWSYKQVTNAYIEGSVTYSNPYASANVNHKHEYGSDPGALETANGYINRKVVTETGTIKYALAKANTWITDYSIEYNTTSPDSSTTTGGKTLADQVVKPRAPASSNEHSCGAIDSAISSLASTVDGKLQSRYSKAMSLYRREGSKGSPPEKESFDSSRVERNFTVETEIKRVEIQDATEDTVTTTKYVAGTPNKIIKDDKTTKPNFVTLFNSYKYRENKDNILSSTDFLFEIMEQNESLSNILTIFKYLLYKATGKNYGVKELDYSIFDPKSYKSANSGSASSSFLEFMKVWEGADMDGAGHYMVGDDGVGIPTVGFGIALMYNVERFAERGIYGVESWQIGQCCLEKYGVDNSIIDEICLQELDDDRKAIIEETAGCNPPLNDQQIDALTAVKYQYGGIGNFVEMYNQYGNTDALRENVHQTGRWAYYFTQNPSIGRAEANWTLFHDGIYLDKDGNSL